MLEKLPALAETKADLAGSRTAPLRHPIKNPMKDFLIFMACILAIGWLGLQIIGLLVKAFVK
jgi:hypothetical protein